MARQRNLRPARWNTTLTRTLRSTAVVGLLGFSVALALSAMPQPAAAQQAAPQGQSQNVRQAKETVKGTFGAWEVVCFEANGGEQCIMRQLGTTSDGKKVVEVQIQKLTDVKTKDGQPVPAAIQITAPLGTLLRRGVQLQIDKAEPRTGSFEVCLPAGCILRDPMSEEMLNQLKAGRVAKVTFAVLNRGEITVDISLNGFTRAFRAL